MKKYIFSILFLFILLFPINAKAELPNNSERITNFNSNIYIEKDGYLTIEENIKVYAALINIKRGIYREIPLDYYSGILKYSLDFEILEVLRDGENINYKTLRKSNGIYIEIAEENKYLSEGLYTFTLKYRIGPMIGYFDNFDELYQNITGTGWSFYIENVTANIYIPESLDINSVGVDAYTGYEGEKNKNYTYTVEKRTNNTLVSFRTTKILEPNQNITVSVSFPKGIVDEIEQSEIVMRAIKSTVGPIEYLLIIPIILIYYIVVWYLLGRDPKSTNIYPRYSPPEDVDAMTTYWIDKMGYSTVSLTSGIIDLAVRGYIKIKQTGEDKYKISVVESKVPDSKLPKALFNLYAYMFKSDKIDLDARQMEILMKFFKDNPDISEILNNDPNSLSISPKYNKRAYVLNIEVKKYFDKNKRKYFKNNFKTLIIPILIWLIQIILILTASNSDMTFFSVFMGGLSVLLLIFLIFPRVKDIKSKNGNLPSFLLLLFYSLIFLIFFFAGLVETDYAGGLVAVYLTVIISYFFQSALKARTTLGREIQDKIEGFKMFIKTTEPNKLKVLYSQFPQSLSYYERLLPYCIALGLEKYWSDKFSEYIAANPQSASSNVIWLSGSTFGSISSSISSGISASMNKSIASSSTAPGSSSGSSGGGSSGGGGGGGGGGGV